MAKSDDTGGSSSKVNTTGDNKYGKNKKSPKIGGLNPSNIYLATKYDDNVPEELVCLHFDDLIMKALKLTPKKPK